MKTPYEIVGLEEAVKKYLNRTIKEILSMRGFAKLQEELCEIGDDYALWDNEDDTFLINNWDVMPLTSLCFRLNRTPKAILSRLYSLGIIESTIGSNGPRDYVMRRKLKLKIRRPPDHMAISYNGADEYIAENPFQMRRRWDDDPLSLMGPGRGIPARPGSMYSPSKARSYMVSYRHLK